MVRHKRRPSTATSRWAPNMPTETAAVRPATHTDFSAIAAMFEDFFAQHHRWQPEQFRPAPIGFTPAIFQTWLEARDAFNLAAVCNGATVGFARGHRFEGFATDFTYPRRGVHIGLIVVAPGMRRCGIGRALFAAIEALAREIDSEFVALNVHPLNDDARAFYAALGYNPDGEYRVKTIRKVKRFEADP
jgi:GNAT superfamily N-acetyltransferase